MKRKPDQVLQFKISLESVLPAIWRRIQIPTTYNFWDLHVAVQDAMGWKDSHLHEFTLTDSATGERLRIGVPAHGVDDAGVLPGWDVPLAHHFGISRRTLSYVYDFGDSWRHDVLFEGRPPRDPAVGYPLCLEGQRACPPEDCGGASGYEKLLLILQDPRHHEHVRLVGWAGAAFDPERFDPDELCFDNPRKRWRMAFVAA